jgi:GT2 family glycosyltransferase
MNHNVFRCDAKKTQYSSIALFHHSNRTTLRLSTGCERSELSSKKFMHTDRHFVLHRNDEGIPANRSIKVIDAKSAEGKSRPAISVIIPTLDGYRDGCFPSLLAQLDEQTCRDFETIIITGDPRQGRAINAGAGLARGNYLLTLDDDTRLLRPDCLEKLIQVFANDPDIGMAGGVNIIPDGASCFVQRVMKEIPRRATPEVKEITESDLAEHPLLIMRKDVFFEVGGENELLPRGLDPYLRMKFRRAGYKVVVVPGVFYSHLPPATYSKLVRQFFRNGKQAAYCNKFFPQWLIETPDSHVSEFVEKRPFHFRAVRYGLRMLMNLLRGRWIYISVYFAYALGFGWGYIHFRDTGQT